MTKQQEQVIATILEVYETPLEPVLQRNMATSLLRSVSEQDDLIVITKGLLATLPHLRSQKAAETKSRN